MKSFNLFSSRNKSPSLSFIFLHFLSDQKPKQTLKRERERKKKNSPKLASISSKAMVTLLPIKRTLPDATKQQLNKDNNKTTTPSIDKEDKNGPFFSRYGLC